MDSLESRVIEAFREGDAYDFVANNYHLMGIEMLKRIALETIYELGNMSNKTTSNMHMNNVADELQNMWED